jgi:hypothetical protein
MWANENEMPTPKMALSKGVIMLGSVPSLPIHRVPEVLYVTACQWLMLVLGDCLFFKERISGVKGWLGIWKTLIINSVIDNLLVEY